MTDAATPEDEGQLPPCAAEGCEHRCSVRRLPASVGDVLRALTLLDHPAAITENRVIRLTQVAAYADAGVPDGPFRVQPGWVSLRLHPEALTGAMLVEPPHPLPGEDPVPELRLCGVDGRPVHRCHPLLPEDRLVLEGLARLDGRLPGPEFTAGADGGWDSPDVPDQLQRIDDLLTWTTTRTPFLPHRHVDPGVLVDVIEHACAVGLPLGIAVFSDAAMHAVQDTVQSVAHAAGIMAVGTQEAILELRPTAVRHCLLLRLHGPHGITSSLELYDSADRRVALISQFGIVGQDVYDAWEQLAESLPELV
ncbi:MAG: hypothetical protein QM582_03050 [Micropruina sp.]|uniref:hypothetical protein n=1 Tax=Micropruina sp. TaxID=2737536 RepID=UPI0039E629E1